jgi:hypothetical protein
MNTAVATLVAVLIASTLAADPLKCDLSEYKSVPGLAAATQGDGLVVTWTGQAGADLRATFGVADGRPVIRELAVRKAGGAWAVLGENLSPEYHVTTGIRRMSEQQAEPLRALGVQITPEVIEKNKWYAFWDSPLDVPGTRPNERAPRAIGLPRKPDEIRRADATF